MSLCIGSFNLRRFGDDADRDIPLIARIITSSDSDIMAIQEASGELAVTRLCQELGTDKWTFSHAAADGFGFAFLWKRTLLSLTAGKTPISVWDSAFAARLKRPPYVGFFGFNNNVVALINIHIVGNAPYSEDKQEEFHCLCESYSPRLSTRPAVLRLPVMRSCLETII